MKARSKHFIFSTHMGYSLTTWLRTIAIMISAIAVITFVLIMNYEHATVNLVSSLNEEFSIHTDLISSKMKDSIINSTMQLYYSPSITTLRTSKDLTNFESILGIRAMNAGTVSNNAIHSVYVYNEAKDYIYTTYESGSFKSASFFDATATEMFKAPGSYQKLTPVLREIPELNHATANQVYSFLVHDDIPGDASGAMLVNVDADVYNNMFFGPSDSSDAKYLLLCQDGTFIGKSSNYTTKTLFDDLSALEANPIQTSESDYFISNIRGSKTIYFYTYLPESNWYLVKVIPYKACISGLKDMYHYAIVILTVMLLCSLLIVYISMKRFYHPLKRIMATLSPENIIANDIPNQFMGNFDGFIADQKETSDSYHALMKTEFLKHLLLSSSSLDSRITKGFPDYNINFKEKKPFYLILIDDGINTDYSECFDTHLTCVHREIFHIEGNTLILFQCDLPDEIEHTCDALYEINNCLCTYSNPIFDIKNLRRNYKRLIELKQLHIFHESKHVMSESWLLKMNKYNVYQDLLETDLLSALKNGTLEEAYGTYHQFVEHCKDYRYSVILFNFKRLYITLDSYYLSLMDGSSKNESIPDMDTVEKRLQSARSQEDIDLMFTDYIKEIISLRQQKNKKQQLLIGCQAREYIKENYTDFNLTLSSISSELSVSSSKLSKAFRQLESMSVNDYINTYRIEQSKELLLNTDMTIKEITGLVGIENSQYFYTLFKNNTGCTPSSFRQAKKIS